MCIRVQQSHGWPLPPVWGDGSQECRGWGFPTFLSSPMTDTMDHSSLCASHTRTHSSHSECGTHIIMIIPELDWALWASHWTSHVLDYLILPTLWDRHCYGHFTDEKIEVQKGKNNFQVAAEELKSRSIQLQSECFQPLCLRPPPSSQRLARCSDLSNTAFHLTWYHCPNSASCTFIFKRRSIASPLWMDLESWARASETRSHRAGAASLGLPFMEGAQAFHFLSSTVTVKKWPLYLLK